MNLLDTIAAVSTPYGKGGVALIRISGEDAIMIADRVFRSASGRKLADTEHAKMLYVETARARSALTTLWRSHSALHIPLRARTRSR